MFWKLWDKIFPVVDMRFYQDFDPLAGERLYRTDNRRIEKLCVYEKLPRIIRFEPERIAHEIAKHLIKGGFVRFKTERDADDMCRETYTVYATVEVVMPESQSARPYWDC